MLHGQITCVVPCFLRTGVEAWVQAQQGQLADAAGIPAAAQQLLQEGIPPVPGSLLVSIVDVEQQWTASNIVNFATWPGHCMYAASETLCWQLGGCDSQAAHCTSRGKEGNSAASHPRCFLGVSTIQPYQWHAPKWFWLVKVKFDPRA
jgi:hypothetical protein